MKRSQGKYHEKYNSFYNSPAWKQLRAERWVSADGLCEMCREKGIVRKADEIHHIVPIEDDWSKRLDFDNLIALCKDCHNEQHSRVSPLKKFLQEFDGDTK